MILFNSKRKTKRMCHGRLLKLWLMYQNKRDNAEIEAGIVKMESRKGIMNFGINLDRLD